MFYTKNIHWIVRSLLSCAIILCVECFPSTETEKELISVETEDPLNELDTFPTAIMPDSISQQHPYLYYSTIAFGLVILGTAVLITLQSCYRTCRKTSYLPFHSPGAVSVANTFRHSFVPTDVIMINGRLDRPPDYETTMLISRDIYQPSYNETPFVEKSETPPPSYGSIF